MPACSACPSAIFDQRASGDLMTRVIEDVNAVERVLIDGTEQGTVAVLSVAGVLIILFCKNASAGRHRAAAHSAAGRRRHVVHADRPPPLPRPTPGLQRHERLPDGQPARRSPDQGLWTPTARGRTLRPQGRRPAPKHAGCHESLGRLFARPWLSAPRWAPPWSSGAAAPSSPPANCPSANWSASFFTSLCSTTRSDACTA